jgi:hypothetical protein
MIAALLLATTAAAQSPQRLEIPLWNGPAPGSDGQTGPEKVRVTDAGDHVVSSVHRPSLTFFGRK